MRWLERSMMPWIVASQTVPIIALAPMIVKSALCTAPRSGS
jgi:ABC-type nitrate/sulfonate/bicarbonate transport system permease component